MPMVKNRKIKTCQAPGDGADGLCGKEIPDDRHPSAKTCCAECSRKKKQAWSLARVNDPEIRERMHKQQKEYRSKPEVKARENAWMRNRRKDPLLKAKTSAWQRKCLYGITSERFDEIFERQHRKCAICEATEPNGNGWNVDHDHNTQAIRGILCGKCNKGIGLLQDSSEVLRKAIVYLEAPGATNEQ